MVQAGWDSGSEDEDRLIKVIGFGMHTLALSQMILKKNDQIIGLEEKWILFE